MVIHLRMGLHADLTHLAAPDPVTGAGAALRDLGPGDRKASSESCDRSIGSGGRV